jgi:hypothetical protein
VIPTIIGESDPLTIFGENPQLFVHAGKPSHLQMEKSVDRGAGVPKVIG